MKGTNNDNRMASILKYFRKTTGTTVGQIASKLGVSERTVRNDIKQLNQELKACAQIESEQGKYRLRIYDVEKFRVIYGKIMQPDDDMNSSRGRMDYTFGRLMRAEEPVLTDELAYEMNIGRTTFLGDLKKLRKELAEYHLFVTGKTSKGLILEGRETDIRSYVLNKVYDTVYKDYPLDEEILEVFQKICQKNHFEKGLRTSLKKYITVMLDRFLTGNNIGHLSARYYSLESLEEFQIAQQMAEEFEEILHIQIPREERLFLFLPIAGMRTPADVENMQSITLDTSIRPLTEKIFSRIESDMKINLRSREFTEEFLYHVMFMVNRLRYGVKLKNPMLDDLTNKYPLAFQMTQIASDVIREELNLEVNEDERGFLAAYFGVFLTEHSMDQKKIFKLAVICGTGRVTARLVSAQLHKILDDSARLTLLSDDNATTEVLNDFDIVLTTVELSCQCSRPVIQIHEIFNEKELLQKIEKAKYWDQIDVPIIDNNAFLLSGLLDESRFFCLEERMEYKEAVAWMADELTLQGYVDEGFTDRLMEREEKGSTVFDGKIALPHTVQYESEKLIMAMGVFNKENKESKNDIKCIIMLGLPQSEEMDDNLLIRVYDEIITIARDEKMLKKIANVTDFSELLQILYR